MSSVPEAPLDPRGQNMRDLSARTLDEVRQVPTETIRKALAALEENLGGREVLAGMLAQAAFTSDEEKFVAILGDPEERTTSLAKLLGVFGLSPARFFKLLADSRATQAVFASMDKVYRRLPDVAEHTMERAVPREVPCPACDGRGTYAIMEPGETPKKCLECKGAGFSIRTPDLDEVKLALQVGGLMKGGSSVVVNQQVDARSLTMNSGGGALLSGDQRSIFKDFSQASDRVLYGRAGQQALPEPPADPPVASIEDSTVVEAEVIPLTPERSLG